jgi:glycosyltransferase A (GT-A) superfamily protein (DUF2064 family)
MSLQSHGPDAADVRSGAPLSTQLACRLLVLAKEPVAGRVKTRLCPPFSAEQAAQLAAAALADTLAAALSAVVKGRSRGYDIQPVLVLDGQPGRWLDELLDGPFQVPIIRQRKGGLDERIAGAFADALPEPFACPSTGSSKAGCALLIGMDTPQVSGRLLVEAFERLSDPGCDAVLGLADDGGWWTMGLHRADENLLHGIPMSTSETGAAQYARLRASGLSVALLPQLRDVDTVADARAVAEIAPRGRFASTVARLQQPLLAA